MMLILLLIGLIHLWGVKVISNNKPSNSCLFIMLDVMGFASLLTGSTFGWYILGASFGLSFLFFILAFILMASGKFDRK